MKRLTWLFVVTGALFCSPAPAQEDFYKGKTINLIIGSAESGMYDSGGRLMARLLQRYIAGAPTIVPRNMPGASSPSSSS